MWPGILLSGNECSQILLSLLLTYFGGQGHRPRLAAIGVICSGISSLLVVMPHFIYGKANPIVTNGLTTTIQFIRENVLGFNDFLLLLLIGTE